MTNNVTEFPSPERDEFLIGPFKEWRVVVAGRVVPKLTGRRNDDGVWLYVDRRFGAVFSTEEDARQAAYLIAQAMAVSAGYSHLEATSKDMPFAPIAMEIGAVVKP